jgi:photosystem II stability/assembly factor-like uncharacterized protein
MKQIFLPALICSLFILGCSRDKVLVRNMIVEKVDDAGIGLNAIAFTGSRGFIAGNGGVVLGSEGGEEWEPVQINAMGTNLDYVNFPTANVGYIAGPGQLLRTTNGGNSWALINSSYDFRDISFPTSDTGYMVHNDSVYKSVDGGQTWLNTSGHVDGGRMRLVSARKVFIYNSPYFKNSYKTTDGGNSWEEITLSHSHEVQELAFYDEHEGILTWGNSILKTTNGGETWKRTEGMYEFPGHVHVYNSRMAFVIGHGAMYASKDRGTTWEERFLEDGTSITEPLRDIFFINSTTGFAVSAKGGIFKLTE